MTDPSPFTPPGSSVPPPSGALPPPSGPPRPDHPQAPPLVPATYGVTPATSGVVPPAPRGRPAWLVPVIVGGVILLLALVGLVIAVAVVVGTAVRGLPAEGPAPLGPAPAAPLAGDPGAPVADDPLECGACFTPADAARLRLALVEYTLLGLELQDGAPFDSTVGAELDLVEQSWTDADGEPDACFFAFPQSPLTNALGDRSGATDDDHVHLPSWHYDESEYYWLTEGTRLFDDSAAAEAHLVGLESAVAGCDTYSIPGSGWSSRLSAAPALDLPANVAGYGWVETGGLNRYYAVDLQRGNLVLRLALNSDGNGPTEREFRDFVEAYAELLGSLEPSGDLAG